MPIELKIKAKHLAAEARIIKDEVRKLKGFTPAKEVVSNRRKGIFSRIDALEATGEYDQERIDKWRKTASSRISMVHKLQHHNVSVVRKAARRTHIVRNFLKGNALKDVERTTNISNRLDDLDWSAIEKMAIRYSSEDERAIKQKLEEWIQAYKTV